MRPRLAMTDWRTASLKHLFKKYLQIIAMARFFDAKKHGDLQK